MRSPRTAWRKTILFTTWACWNQFSLRTVQIDCNPRDTLGWERSFRLYLIDGGLLS